MSTGDYTAESRGHYSILVNRADYGDLDSHDIEAGRVWTWMLVDTDDPDRGILDGCDTWEPLTRADAEKAARASLAEHAEPWTVTFTGDRDHDAWALVDPSGEQHDDYWYDSRDAAQRVADERNAR